MTLVVYPPVAGALCGCHGTLADPFRGDSVLQRAVRVLSLFGVIAGLLLGLADRVHADFALRVSPYVADETCLRGATFDSACSKGGACAPPAKGGPVATPQPSQSVSLSPPKPADDSGRVPPWSGRSDLGQVTGSSNNSAPPAPGGAPCAPQPGGIPITPDGLSHGGSAGGSPASGAGTSPTPSGLVPADFALRGLDLAGKLFLADERCNPQPFASRLFRPPRVCGSNATATV